MRLLCFGVVVVACSVLALLAEVGSQHVDLLLKRGLARLKFLDGGGETFHALLGLLLGGNGDSVSGAERARHNTE